MEVLLVVKMSRYSKSVFINAEMSKELEKISVKIEWGEYKMAYGYDHAVYYFYQFFKGDEVVTEEDSLFNGLTGLRLGQLLDLFQCKQHANFCKLDMEF
jgi:hypothetical protein